MGFRTPASLVMMQRVRTPRNATTAAIREEQGSGDAADALSTKNQLLDLVA